MRLNIFLVHKILIKYKVIYSSWWTKIQSFIWLDLLLACTNQPHPDYSLFKPIHSKHFQDSVRLLSLLKRKFISRSLSPNIRNTFYPCTNYPTPARTPVRPLTKLITRTVATSKKVIFIARDRTSPPSKAIRAVSRPVFSSAKSAFHLALPLGLFSPRGEENCLAATSVTIVRRELALKNRTISRDAPVSRFLIAGKCIKISKVGCFPNPAHWRCSARARVFVFSRLNAGKVGQPTAARSHWRSRGKKCQKSQRVAGERRS